MVQNGPIMENSDTTATVIAATIGPTEREFPAKTRATAPTKAGPAVCQRYSPDLSAFAPMSTMTTSAAAYGMAERNPIAIVSTPERLRITEGNQKVIPYPAQFTPKNAKTINQTSRFVKTCPKLVSVRPTESTCSLRNLPISQVRHSTGSQSAFSGVSVR